MNFDFSHGSPRLYRFGCTVLSAMAVVVIHQVDRWVPAEISLSIFYLLPISWAAWTIDRTTSLGIALFSSIAWLTSEYPFAQLFSASLISWIPFWNAVVRLGFFLITAFLLSALKTAYSRETYWARHDSLTGATNRRFFMELLQQIGDRSDRHQNECTLVYLDLDNFKQVNDRFGHEAGDRLLCNIVRELRSHLRSDDVVARLGGDEFALLFPSMKDADVRLLLQRLHAHLVNWIQSQPYSFVGFSMGAIIYIAVRPDSSELLQAADRLMYGVKQNGKNQLAIRNYRNLGEANGSGCHLERQDIYRN